MWVTVWGVYFEINVKSSAAPFSFLTFDVLMGFHIDFSTCNGMISDICDKAKISVGFWFATFSIAVDILRLH